MENIYIGSELLFDVVVNSEGQYSVWASGKSVPRGWSAVGYSGVKENCLSYIKEVWVDMRPLSLRQEMEGLTEHKEISA